MSQTFKQLLVKKLNFKKELEHLLPKNYQKIGDIVIINIDSKIQKFEKEIGKTILNQIPETRVVCKKIGIIKGEKRTPQIKVIAGGRNTETVHKENGCLFKLDVRKTMFAKGNVKERGRIAKLIKSNEIVVDMFSGIGYFSLPIAKFSKVKKIYAIDINPVAIKYLKENIQLNGLNNIEVIFGDCRKIAKNIGKIADRVIMGYLPNTNKFLPVAFSFLKKEGGIIHYHDIFKEEDLWNKPVEILRDKAKENGYILEKILHKRIVKSYAPRIYHIVIDAKFLQN